MKNLFVSYTTPTTRGNAVLSEYEDDVAIENMSDIRDIRDALLSDLDCGKEEIIINNFKWLPY